MRHHFTPPSAMRQTALCAASSREIRSVVKASATEVAAGTELVARTTSQMRVTDEAAGRVPSIIVDVANASSDA